MGKTLAIIIARLIFAGVFLMAATFKFIGMQATADYIAAAGLPLSLALAWIAALFEVALVVCFLTGTFFTEAALSAAAYILFLAITFHGPSHWEGNQAEFGFFVDHFSFLAGLLFAAVHGPGDRLALRAGLIWKQRIGEGPRKARDPSGAAGRSLLGREYAGNVAAGRDSEDLERAFLLPAHSR